MKPLEISKIMCEEAHVKPDRELFCRQFFKDADFRFRLRILVSRTLGEPPKTSKQRVFDMYYKTDEEIIQELKAARKTPDSIPKASQKRKTYIGRFKIVVQELGLNTINNLLDVGAGDGTLTSAMAKILKASNVHACDVAEYGDVRSRISNFHVSPPDGGLPQISVQFDLITIVQVLHHVKSPERLLHEVHATLRPGGFVLIKEHDACTPKMKQLFIIEHALFHHVKEAGSDGEWYSEEQLEVKSQAEWDDLFGKCGFRIVKKYIDENEITNSFWGFYQKE